jgi:hypothetical protein
VVKAEVQVLSPAAILHIFLVEGQGNGSIEFLPTTVSEVVPLSKFLGEGKDVPVSCPLFGKQKKGELSLSHQSANTGEEKFHTD